MALKTISTEARTDFLRRLGFKVTEIWECEAEEQLKKNPALLAQIMRNPIIAESPLVHTDGLYGGRTETIRLLFEGRAGYKDITSQYPFTQKYTRYVKILIFYEQLFKIIFFLDFP